MSWLLLATPTFGVLALIAALWIGHWLAPLEKGHSARSRPRINRL
jgi:hypothetical protein